MVLFVIVSTDILFQSMITIQIKYNVGYTLSSKLEWKPAVLPQSNQLEICTVSASYRFLCELIGFLLGPLTFFLQMMMYRRTLLRFLEIFNYLFLARSSSEIALPHRIGNWPHWPVLRFKPGRRPMMGHRLFQCWQHILDDLSASGNDPGLVIVRHNF